MTTKDSHDILSTKKSCKAYQIKAASRANVISSFSIQQLPSEALLREADNTCRKKMLELKIMNETTFPAGYIFVCQSEGENICTFCA